MPEQTFSLRQIEAPVGLSRENRWKKNQRLICILSSIGMRLWVCSCLFLWFVVIFLVTRQWYGSYGSVLICSLNIPHMYVCSWSCWSRKNGEHMYLVSRYWTLQILVVWESMANHPMFGDERWWKMIMEDWKKTLFYRFILFYMVVSKHIVGNITVVSCWLVVWNHRVLRCCNLLTKWVVHNLAIWWKTSLFEPCWSWLGSKVWNNVWNFCGEICAWRGIGLCYFAELISGRCPVPMAARSMVSLHVHRSRFREIAWKSGNPHPWRKNS